MSIPAGVFGWKMYGLGFVKENVRTLTGILSNLCDYFEDQRSAMPTIGIWAQPVTCLVKTKTNAKHLPEFHQDHQSLKC